MILRPRNPPEDAARSELLVINAEPSNRRLHQRQLVGFIVDGKAFRQSLIADAQRFDVAPQQAHTKRVKC